MHAKPQKEEEETENGSVKMAKRQKLGRRFKEQKGEEMLFPSSFLLEVSALKNLCHSSRPAANPVYDSLRFSLFFICEEEGGTKQLRLFAGFIFMSLPPFSSSLRLQPAADDFLEACLGAITNSFYAAVLLYEDHRTKRRNPRLLLAALDQKREGKWAAKFLFLQRETDFVMKGGEGRGKA